MYLKYDDFYEVVMYYFIVNTQSRTGNAARIWNEVKVVLKKENVQYKAFETSFEGHATELARSLTENTTDIVHIIIMGGDGTINEVVNGIADFDKVRLGVIPTGTGNDFARNLGIKGSTEEIIHDILNTVQGIKLDIGAVEWGEEHHRRLFTISSGIGFDALVCKYALTSHVKRVFNMLHLGKLAYLVLTVRSLFAIKTYDADASFGKHSDRTFKKVIFSAAMNLRAEGGGVPMAPSSNPSDGLVAFCVASDIPLLILPFCLILLVLGKHEKLKYFHIFNDVSAHIHTSTPVVLHADGEYLADVTDVWYECLPKRLELLNTIRGNKSHE